MGARKEYEKNKPIVDGSELIYLREAETHRSPNGKTKRTAMFLCSCGKVKRILITSVLQGLTKTCGKCPKKYNHKFYSIYSAMISRCYNKNNKSYKNYGGRGIQVCDVWKNDHEQFFDWMEENNYSKGLQIDRIDNDQGYSPDNCRVVTLAQNLRNQRKSKYWHVHGSVYESSTEAGKDVGVNAQTIARWCDGYVASGKFIPPKDNCYSVPKYPADIERLEREAVEFA